MHEPHSYETSELRATQLNTGELTLPHPRPVIHHASRSGNGYNGNGATDVTLRYTNGYRTQPVLRRAFVAPAATQRYLAVRRVLDIALVLAIAPVALVICLVAALAIRIESPGSPLFLQTRRGRNGRPFSILKLRTMYATQVPSTSLTALNDPRITKVGRILRRFHIDELPQLWNVLTGDMAVIGPRPMMESAVWEYSHTIPGYNNRHVVLPGLTGLGMVCVGHTDNTADERRRYRYDIHYITNASLRMDLWVLGRTVLTFLTGFGIR